MRLLIIVDSLYIAVEPGYNEGPRDRQNNYVLVEKVFEVLYNVYMYMLPIMIYWYTYL